MSIDLTPRQGKVLRFIVARTKEGPYKAPVVPVQTINKIDWSDLPHSLTQASFTFSKLWHTGLIEQIEGGYQATAAGTDLIKKANAAGLWQS